MGLITVDRKNNLIGNAFQNPTSNVHAEPKSPKATIKDDPYDEGHKATSLSNLKLKEELIALRK